MKRTLIIAGAIIVLGGISYLYSTNKVDYKQQEVEIKEVEVEKEVLSRDVRVKAAQDAARSEIEAKAQSAFDNTFDNAMDEIKAEVLEEMELEFKTERIEIEKRTGAY